MRDDDQNKDSESPPTFGRRINEALGDKPHGWYFLYGIAVSVLVLWAVYVTLVVPTIDRTYSRIFDQQNQTNRELQVRNTSLNLEVVALRDTVMMLQSFGQ